MGYSLSWIAVKGSTKEAVLDGLGLADTGRPADYKRGLISITELPKGWVVLSAIDFEYATPERLAIVSAAGSAVSCSVEEQVMVSEAHGYADGRKVWSVVHDPDQGSSIYHLTVSGDPPAELAGIKTRLIREQDEAGGEDADVDYIFGIPTELAGAICGYRHDEDPGEGEPPEFTVVERQRGAVAAPAARGPKPARNGGGFFANLFKKR